MIKTGKSVSKVGSEESNFIQKMKIILQKWKTNNGYIFHSFSLYQVTHVNVTERQNKFYKNSLTSNMDFVQSNISDSLQLCNIATCGTVKMVAHFQRHALQNKRINLNYQEKILVCTFVCMEFSHILLALKATLLDNILQTFNIIFYNI